MNKKLNKEEFIKLISSAAEICSDKDYYTRDETCTMIYRAIESLYERLYSMEENFSSMLSKHQEGHLPPIKGAEKIKNALEVLGISEDYDVVKKVIYANKKGKKGELIIKFNEEE